MESKLQDWFCRYKCDNSVGKPAGSGRLDPKNGKKLFTPDTKQSIEEGCKSCHFLADVLPLEEVYTTIPPTKRMAHGLSTYLSNRGESRLENFHGKQAHFGNCGMRTSLADFLAITGCARHNVRIRFKKEGLESRVQDLPAWTRAEPLFFNHSDLAVVNELATSLGVEAPFPNARELAEDNGEKFMSEYLIEQRERHKTVLPHRENDRCQCRSCAKNDMPLQHELKEALQLSLSLTPKEATVSAEETKIWNPYKRKVVWQHDRPSLETSSPKRRKVDVTIKKFALTLEDDEIIGADDVDDEVVELETSQQPPRQSPVQQMWPQFHMAPVAMMPPVMAPMMAPMVPSMMPPMMQPFPWGVTMAAPFQAPQQRRAKLQVEYCCAPFTEWSTNPNRNGRPPHDRSCRKHPRNKKS